MSADTSENRQMGFIKRQMEEEDARGWRGSGEKWVCATHVQDDALECLLAENASSTSCSYCDHQDSLPFAAELDLLVERIATSLSHEWGNADDEGVAWEGGYVGQTYNSYDLLTEVADWPLNDGQLIADVVAALPEHSWAQRDYYRLRPHERLRFGWEEFSEVVKHHRRYFFTDHHADDSDADSDYVAPGAMLAAIGDAIKSASLLRELHEGHLVFRVRDHPAAERPRTASQLGAPPLELINSSKRMSAAGIPMFYGALDKPTAVIEAKETNPNAESFTLGYFELRKAIRVVDLSASPDVPSLFDIDRRHLRPALIFLRYFAHAIAEPFVRDDQIHIDYVPTQVVTEWIRTRLDAGEAPVEGILYQSARHDSGTNVVLFIDNDGACDLSDDDESALLLLRRSELL